MEGQAKTVVAVALDGRAVGLIALSDMPKPDARETVGELNRRGLETVMVTGDNERTAQAVAQKLGVTTVHAGVLPGTKAEILRGLQEAGKRVVMVGDGINDAPALMQADVGMAMGAGTDIAMESADVILIGKRLSAVVDALHVGGMAYRKTRQNVTLAFLFNGIGVPLATTGLVHPVWAMVAMGASVSTVLLNSFGGRLLPRQRAKRQIETLRLGVPSMHCDGCLQAITEAVETLSGVERVHGDVEEKVVEFILRDRGTADEVRQRILKMGHVISE